jgi:hypothetical protein
MENASFPTPPDAFVAPHAAVPGPLTTSDLSPTGTGVSARLAGAAEGAASSASTAIAAAQHADAAARHVGDVAARLAQLEAALAAMRPAALAGAAADPAAQRHLDAADRIYTGLRKPLLDEVGGDIGGNSNFHGFAIPSAPQELSEEHLVDAALRLNVAKDTMSAGMQIAATFVLEVTSQYLRGVATRSTLPLRRLLIAEMRRITLIADGAGAAVTDASRVHSLMLSGMDEASAREVVRLDREKRFRSEVDKDSSGIRSLQNGFERQVVVHCRERGVGDATADSD